MQFKSILLATAVATAGVSAHPSMSSHANHARSHEKRGNFMKSTPSKTTEDLGDAIASVASSVGDAVESIVSSVTDAVYKEFCSGSGVSRRATTADIASVGNTGTADDYGCNMMEVDASIAHMYSYTIEVTNVASEEYAFVCFNKIGNTGGINGFFKGMGEGVITTVPAGGSLVVALESNSQGGCAWGPGSSVPTNDNGCYAGTWLEFDVDSDKNSGYSGADISALVSADSGTTIYGGRVCPGSGSSGCESNVCSTIFPGGAGVNAYTAGTNDLDGVGMNCAPGNVTLVLEIGYSG